MFFVLTWLIINEFESVNFYIYLDVVTVFQSAQKYQMSLDFRNNTDNLVTGEF